MQKLARCDYHKALTCIDRRSCGAVYPLSIAEGRQQGDIFLLGKSTLFWHYAGFAFLYGEYDEADLQSIYDSFLAADSNPPRRFIPFVTAERARRFFETKPDLALDTRCFFTYPRSAPPKPRPLPDGLAMREIDSTLFDRIQGRITPLFSFADKTDFLANGKGFCVTDGDTPAAWAFSAATSSEETDIGVETREEYRGHGLATLAAEEMIRSCLAQGRRPVWACHSENKGSFALALKAGFEKTAECFTVRRK